MPWLALALALTVAAPAGPAAPPGAAAGDALGALAAGVAQRLGPPEEGRRGLALALQAEPAALGGPAAAALTAALGQAGWAVSPVAAGPGAEAAARAAGADWLLALTAGGDADGRELVAVGEAVSLWPSFFLQARPGVRAAPPRPISARAATDAAARLLLRGSGAAAPPSFALRRLATVPGDVVALAAGALEGLGPVILAICDDGPAGAQLRLLDRRGVELAARPAGGAPRRPTRRLAATAVIAPLGGGAIGVALAGGAGGEVLARRGARLERTAALPMAPLAAGGAGVLFGAFAPGKAALQDLASVGVDATARPRSPGDLVGAAAAPGGAAPAFALLHPGGRLELLDGALAAAGEVDGVGAGFALADLDGDGRAELVASATGPGGPDRVRVLRPEGTPDPAARWASPPIPGAVLAAAAWDLSGDGLDDVVLAAFQPAADGPAATDLWLLTLDPREAP